MAVESPADGAHARRCPLHLHKRRHFQTALKTKTTWARSQSHPASTRTENADVSVASRSSAAVAASVHHSEHQVALAQGATAAQASRPLAERAQRRASVAAAAVSKLQRRAQTQALAATAAVLHCCRPARQEAREKATHGNAAQRQLRLASRCPPTNQGCLRKRSGGAEGVVAQTWRLHAGLHAPSDAIDISGSTACRAEYIQRATTCSSERRGERNQDIGPWLQVQLAKQL
jgi:hypothetical protein